MPMAKSMSWRDGSSTAPAMVNMSLVLRPSSGDERRNDSHHCEDDRDQYGGSRPVHGVPLSALHRREGIYGSAWDLIRAVGPSWWWLWSRDRARRPAEDAERIAALSSRQPSMIVERYVQENHVDVNGLAAVQCWDDR